MLAVPPISGQLSAGITAAKEIGVLSGKHIERSEIGAPDEFDSLANDDWNAIIERIQALGLVG